MLKTVAVDELAERAALGVDAGGDGFTMDAEGFGHIGNLQFGSQIGVLLLH